MKLMKVEVKEISEECTICLENGTQHVLPCGHHFHHHCIYQWFEHPPPTCPICRNDYTGILLV